MSFVDMYNKKRIIFSHFEDFSPVICQNWLRQLQKFWQKFLLKMFLRHVERSFNNSVEAFPLKVQNNFWKNL